MPGRLKILPVEIADAAGAQAIERPGAAAERRWHAQARNCREQIGPEQRGMPGDGRAPVVADDQSVSFAECCHQRHHVADGIEDAIGGDIGGRAGSSEPPHVRRHHMKSGLRERLDLVPPRIGQFRPAVTEHHQRPFAPFKQEKFDPIGGNRA